MEAKALSDDIIWLVDEYGNLTTEHEREVKTPVPPSPSCPPEWAFDSDSDQSEIILNVSQIFKHRNGNVKSSSEVSPSPSPLGTVNSELVPPIVNVELPPQRIVKAEVMPSNDTDAKSAQEEPIPGLTQTQAPIPSLCSDIELDSDSDSDSSDSSSSIIGSDLDLNVADYAELKRCRRLRRTTAAESMHEAFQGQYIDEEEENIAGRVGEGGGLIGDEDLTFEEWDPREDMYFSVFNYAYDEQNGPQVATLLGARQSTLVTCRFNDGVSGKCWKGDHCHFQHPLGSGEPEQERPQVRFPDSLEKRVIVPTGTFTLAYITHVNNPSDFYMIPTSYFGCNCLAGKESLNPKGQQSLHGLSGLEKMKRKLSKQIRYRLSSFQTDMYEANQLVACRLDLDDGLEWHRGVVLKTTKVDLTAKISYVPVQLIDNGRKLDVPFIHCAVLPTPFCWQPPYVYRCRLAGAVPIVGVNFTDGAIRYFKRLVINREISVEIMKRASTPEESGSGFSLFGKGQYYSVNLDILKQKQPKLGAEMTLRSGFGDTTNNEKNDFECIEDPDEDWDDLDSEFDSSDDHGKIGQEIEISMDSTNYMKHALHYEGIEGCKEVNIPDESINIASKSEANDENAVSNPNGDLPNIDELDDKNVDTNTPGPNSPKLRRDHKKVQPADFVRAKKYRNVKIVKLIGTRVDETGEGKKYESKPRNASELLEKKEFAKFVRTPAQLKKKDYGCHRIMDATEFQSNDNCSVIPRGNPKLSIPLNTPPATLDPLETPSNLLNEPTVCTTIPIIQEEVVPKSLDSDSDISFPSTDES